MLPLQVKVDLGVMATKGIHSILQSSKTRASPSDCLLLYLGHLFGESYPSAEMQSVHSTSQLTGQGKSKEKQSKYCCDERHGGYKKV